MEHFFFPLPSRNLESDSPVHFLGPDVLSYVAWNNSVWKVSMLAANTRQLAANPHLSAANPYLSATNPRLSAANHRLSAANPHWLAANPSWLAANPCWLAANSWLLTLIREGAPLLQWGAQHPATHSTTCVLPLPGEGAVVLQYNVNSLCTLTLCLPPLPLAWGWRLGHQAGWVPVTSPHSTCPALPTPACLPLFWGCRSCNTASWGACTLTTPHHLPSLPTRW
jgi:hypothetical protein